MEARKKGRTLVVGDVHGCLDELKELLRRADFRKGADRLVVLGDLTDRGPDSGGVVRLVRELGGVGVVGNHDDRYVRWARHEARKAKDPSYENPIELKADNLRTLASLETADLAWLARLPRVLPLAVNVVAVHGGLRPYVPLHEQMDYADVIRIRYIDAETGEVAKGPRPWTRPEGARHWSELWQGPETVLYGHEVHSLTSPRLTKNANGGNTVGLDTGCVFGGHLSGLFLETWELVQVRARREYAPLHRALPLYKDPNSKPNRIPEGLPVVA